MTLHLVRISTQGQVCTNLKQGPKRTTLVITCIYSSQPINIYVSIGRTTDGSSLTLPKPDPEVRVNGMEFITNRAYISNVVPLLLRAESFLEICSMGLLE